jgi:serine/threonine protein kinase/CRP-like cAMP-binding protein
VLVRVDRGTKVITEGDTKDRRFFLIKAGRFEIRKGNKVLAQISSGEGVGELALFASGRARSATVIALEPAELYVLPHSGFWEVTSLSLPKLKSRAIAAIKTVPSFQKMFGGNQDLIEQVAVKLFFKRYKPGDVILKTGHAGNAFYILLEGSIVIKGLDDHHNKISSFLSLTNIPRNAMTNKKAASFLGRLLNISNSSTPSSGENSGENSEENFGENSGEKTSATEHATEMRVEVRVLSVEKLEEDEKRGNEKIHISFEVKNLNRTNVATMRETMRASLTNPVLISKRLEKCAVVDTAWVGEIHSPFNQEGTRRNQSNQSGSATLGSSGEREERNDDITLSQPGITFGERSLLTDEPVSRDVVASGAGGRTITLVGGLTKQAFQQLPSNVLVMIEKQLLRQILNSHEVLAHLPEEKKSYVESQVEFKSWKHQEYIIEENRPVECLFIVQSGSCDVTKLPHAKAPRSEAVKVSTKVNVNSVLGEVSLRTNKNATASVIARGPTSCFTFPKDIFNEYLRTSPYLKRLAEKRNMTNVKTVKLQSLKNVNPSHFVWEHPLVLNRELSTLQLVCHHSTGGYFGCKKISIRLMEEKTKHTRLVEERHILLTIQSTFCIKLFTTFVDSRNIYMLEEFCPGGHLLGVLERPGYTSSTGALTPTECGYAIGCVAFGLNCCHTHNVLLRGLSPENLFIDASGLIKLGNFEFAKQLAVGEFTMTVCGCLEFMSPEQAFGHGQALTADLWSLGCLMYELLVGVTPFADSSGDVNIVHQKILQGLNEKILSSVDDCGGPHAKEMIEGLLQSTPGNRLGAKSFKELKHHPWFHDVGVDMSELFCGRFPSGPPAWKPTINHERIGEYYYDQYGDPLRFEEMRNSAGHDGGGSDSTKEGASQAKGNPEMPWYHMFSK